MPETHFPLLCYLVSCTEQLCRQAGCPQCPTACKLVQHQLQHKHTSGRHTAKAQPHPTLPWMRLRMGSTIDRSSTVPDTAPGTQHSTRFQHAAGLCGGACCAVTTSCRPGSLLQCNFARQHSLGSSGVNRK